MPDKPERSEKASRGGLTMPADPARELQRLMMEERPSPTPDTASPVTPSAPPLDATPTPATEPAKKDDSNIARYEGSTQHSKEESEQHSNIATAHVSTLGRDKARLQHSEIASERDSERGSSIASTLTWMRATNLSQLNIRIPDGMNDWLEEEAHRNRKRGVTKQSLVTDALEEFIRRRMEEAAETEGER